MHQAVLAKQLNEQQEAKAHQNYGKREKTPPGLGSQRQDSLLLADHSILLYKRRPKMNPFGGLDDVLFLGLLSCTLALVGISWFMLPVPEAGLQCETLL